MGRNQYLNRYFREETSLSLDATRDVGDGKFGLLILLDPDSDISTRFGEEKNPDAAINADIIILLRRGNHARVITTTNPVGKATALRHKPEQYPYICVQKQGRVFQYLGAVLDKSLLNDTLTAFFNQII